MQNHHVGIQSGAEPNIHFTDGRGVGYQIDRHTKTRDGKTSTSLTFRRVTPRPVDIKRAGRPAMSRAARRARNKVSFNRIP